jgi:glutaconate CoA-transferase subunit B
LRLGGPTKVVTPKATFAFDKAAARLRLESIHPPYSLDEIRENTGFDVGASGRVNATVPPSADELETLRQVVRRKMIDTGTYSTWAERTLGTA